ncbi:hypothetical protein KSW81_006756 [Nannochloris sp. 'desiccata']|nr:hypothetical protein KSW81_006756 [Chlorella desiccata (nom. nud.)]
MEALEAARSHAGEAKQAKKFDKVFKDECMVCFRSPFSPDGLYVNLNTFQGFCRHHVDLDHERSGNVLYLNIKQTKVPVEAAEEPDKPDKLAIGVPGGFDVGKPKENIEEECSLAVLPLGTLVPLPCPDLPASVLESIISIQAHESASAQTEAEAWEEERNISKYADSLEQLPCSRKIPMDPMQWKCDETGVTENLWLNLSTGHIGSGRPHWDGTGGNGSALRHFEATGKKYPLVVKLGTITPSGADVYSYAEDENDMMEKTEKTMAELQVEKNLSYEFDKITEAGADLQPLSGEGYMGLKNLGNTCYMNSVLQILWTMPELYQQYVPSAEAIYKSAPPALANDFLTQFAKVGVALAGPVASDVSDVVSVSPMNFKTLVGRGHPEFSSQRQQDAQEYFSYLIDMLGRAEHTDGSRLNAPSKTSTKLLEFGSETRIECLTSHRVSYMNERSTVLSLEIPLDAAVNIGEVADYNEREQKRQKLKSEEVAEEKVLPKVPFAACIEKYGAAEEIEDYFSAYLKGNSKAKKTTRFASFPSYLMVHLRRYYIAEDWSPKKLEVLVDIPDQISLESLRSRGPRPEEELQPQSAGEEADETLVAQLMSMGFPESKCKRAALSTGNKEVEAAMEWLLVHGDEGEEPLAATAAADADSIAMLEGMGFGAEKAKAALAACENNVERAVDWLFSRIDDSAPVQEETATPVDDAADHKGNYELVGFISHMGKNTGCGHYVCHIKKNGRWTIFNDEKVAVSEKPPKELGYMYLYKRVE